jgi:hypothetical protein
MEALKQRNTFLVEDIVNSNDGESRIDQMRRLTVKVRAERGLPPLPDVDPITGLTEEEEEVLLRELGYDV